MADCQRCKCGILDEDIETNEIAFGYETRLCQSCTNEFAIFFHDRMLAHEILDVELVYLLKHSGSNIDRLKELTRQTIELRYKANIEAMRWVENGITE